MKTFRRLALVAFAALPILAQGSQRGQTPQPEPGVVRGTVLRAGRGEPVTGAIAPSASTQVEIVAAR